MQALRNPMFLLFSFLRLIYTKAMNEKNPMNSDCAPKPQGLENASIEDKLHIQALVELNQRLRVVESLYANVYAKTIALEKIIANQKAVSSKS